MKFGSFPIEGGDTWEGVVEQCAFAEQVGFETCWVNDHQATEGRQLLALTTDTPDEHCDRH